MSSTEQGQQSSFQGVIASSERGLLSEMVIWARKAALSAMRERYTPTRHGEFVGRVYISPNPPMRVRRP